MYSEIGTVAISDRRIVSIYDGTVANQIWQATSTGSTSTFQVYTNNAFVVQINSTSNSSGKSAAGYKVNDFAASVNGGTVSTDTSGAIPVVDRLAFGVNTAGIGALNSTIKKLAYYPKRLSNTELQAITS